MKKLFIALVIVSAFIMVPVKAKADVIIKAVPEKDLEELTHLIMAEGGSDYLPDDVPYGVGTVVLNRVASKNYPNTIHGVIHQPGQYAVASYYMSVEPTGRCYRIAYDLLSNGSEWPSNIIYQAQFTQGSGIYKSVNGEYFCYE